MRDALLAIALVVTAAASAIAQPSSTGALDPPRSPRNASYTITARLDPSSRTITGSEVITWRNITSKPAQDLQLHLYWNAWKNTQSTFMRESALAGFGDDPTRLPNEWARIDVGSIAVGAVRLDRRRDRRRARSARRGARSGPSLLSGRRARLRLDDEPRLPRAPRALRARDAAARRDATAPAAGARGPGGAALRRDAHDAEVLRRVVRAVSLRAHHDRRSRVSERRRRHGIPDALHRRHALARAGPRDDAGGRHRARGRTPVLVRHRRQQRVRGRVDGRGVQHVLDGARDRAGLRSERSRAALLRRLRAVGVQ